MIRHSGSPRLAPLAVGLIYSFFYETSFPNILRTTVVQLRSPVLNTKLQRRIDDIQNEYGCTAVRSLRGFLPSGSVIRDTTINTTVALLPLLPLLSYILTYCIYL